MPVSIWFADGCYSRVASPIFIGGIGAPVNLKLLLSTMMLTVAAPACASEALFTIVKLDGARVEVTDTDFEKIGSITIETPLIGQEERSEAMHAVTGPLLRDVLKYFSVEGVAADATAFDAYEIDIPVDDARRYNVVLARSIDGKKLTLRNRGPVWITYPLKDNPELLNPMYEARSVWQLKELHMK